MKFRANKMLGLAVGEKSILLAEVSSATGHCQITRTGEFVYAEGMTLQLPELLGQGLCQFLKTNGFTARAATFGIPAKWVLTKGKELPPVDPTLTADMLRLQVESEFSAELKDLVYDYAGESSSKESTRVLLAATPKRHVDQALAIADAARLDPQAIAPTSVILSAVTQGNASDALMLSITPSGTELAAQRGAIPSLLRHIGSSASVTATVAGEVRRAALLLPRNDFSSGRQSSNGHSNGQGQVVVWDDVATDPSARRTVTDALGPTARSGDFSLLGAGELPAGMQEFAAAVALAVAGIGQAPMPINFLHPRLAAPKKAALPRQTILAIAAGIALIVGVIYAYIDLHAKEQQRTALLAQLESIKDIRKNAEADVAMTTYAQGWHAEKPRYLSCLRDITIVIPDDGGMYLTSFSLHDSMKGDLAGKASVEKKRPYACRSPQGKQAVFRRENVPGETGEQGSVFRHHFQIYAIVG